MIGSVCICGYVTKQQLIFKHIVKWVGEEGRVAPPAYSSLSQTCMSVYLQGFCCNFLMNSGKEIITCCAKCISGVST